MTDLNYTMTLKTDWARTFARVRQLMKGLAESGQLARQFEILKRATDQGLGEAHAAYKKAKAGAAEDVPVEVNLTSKQIQSLMLSAGVHLAFAIGTAAHTNNDQVFAGGKCPFPFSDRFTHDPPVNDEELRKLFSD